MGDKMRGQIKGKEKEEERTGERETGIKIGRGDETRHDEKRD